MKALASLALVIPVVCMAQAPTPTITFEKTDFDFGKISAERKVTHRFKVTNTGNATLNITRINPSCGCTSTVLGKWSLAPGESTEVEASFDPRGYRGPVHKTIQVVSDDPAHATVTLSFEAEISQDIMPSTNTVFFYDVTRTAPKRSTIKLASGNGLPVRVKEIKAPGAPYLNTAVRMEGNDALVDIDLDAKKIALGKQRGADNLTIFTSSDKMPTIVIAVQWEIKASVVSTPDWISWDEPAGKEHQAAIVLKQAEGKPFRVTGFKSSNPLVSVKGAGQPGAPQQELNVLMAGSAKPGNYTGNVTLLLDDPNQPELNLRVSANLH